MRSDFEFDQVSVGYGKAVVIAALSFHVEVGEFIAVIGPNGAGKTTTLNAAMGVIPLRSGVLRYGGHDVTAEGPERRLGRGIVLVPEGRELFPTLSVLDNLRLGAFRRHLKRDRSTDADLDRVFQTFPILAERRRQMAGTLSGGEQQMLAIGRALMARPKLLMLDEPSTGLAPRIVQEIFEAIGDLKKQGMTAILVEQNARLALSLADRAFVLEGGRFVLEGTAAQLLDNPRVAHVYLGGGPYSEGKELGP